MSMSRTKQNLVVTCLALTVILCSIATTVYVNDQIKSSNADGQGYQNITFTDAVLACDKKSRAEFGSSLSQLVVDRHSSRFDTRAFVFKIFLVAYSKKDKHETSEFFITCYVKSSNGRISKFETFENSGAKEGEAIKKGGDKFIEWPQ